MSHFDERSTIKQEDPTSSFALDDTDLPSPLPLTLRGRRKPAGDNLCFSFRPTKSASTTSLKLLLLLSLLLLQAKLTLGKPAAPTPAPPPTLSSGHPAAPAAEQTEAAQPFPPGDEDEGISPEKVLLPRQMSAGSGCSGSEGQWNCMTSSWQRCAAGRWSVVMQMSAGSVCTPSGLTYDFKVQHASGGSTSGASSSATGSSISRADCSPGCWARWSGLFCLAVAALVAL